MDDHLLTSRLYAGHALLSIRGAAPIPALDLNALTSIGVEMSGRDHVAAPVCA